MPPPPPTPTPEPATPTPEPTTPTPSPADVRISCILFDGVVARYESDEYVEIVNAGGTAQGLDGWTLRDATTGHPSLVFTDFTLAPGQAVRVYTNEDRAEWGGLTFGRGTAVWSNSNPDVAELRDADGRLVSSATYDPANPPGCR